MKKPKYWSLAKKTLSKKDKVIKKIIATHSGSLVSRSDPFFSNLNYLAVVYQDKKLNILKFWLKNSLIKALILRS